MQKLLIVEIQKCQQTYLDQQYPGLKCANDTEIDRVINNINLMVPVMNEYFD